MPYTNPPFFVIKPNFDNFGTGSEIPLNSYDDAGTEVMFRIRRLLGKGGNGRAYLVEKVDEPGSELVLKLPVCDPSRFCLDTESALIRKRAEEKLVALRKENDRELRLAQKNLRGSDFANSISGLWRVQYEIAPFNKELLTPVVIVSTQPYLRREDGWISLTSWVKSIQGGFAERWNKLSVSDWTGLAQSLAQALVDVHNRRIVHGDVWGPNVYLKLAVDGRSIDAVKLIDFGEAFDPTSALEGSGYGRPHPYAAPERHNSIVQHTEQMDIYALGVLLLWVAIGPAVGRDEDDKVHSSKVKNLLDAGDTWHEVKGRLKASGFSNLLEEILVASLASGEAKSSFETRRNAENQLRKIPEAETALTQLNQAFEDVCTDYIGDRLSKTLIDQRIETLRSWTSWVQYMEERCDQFFQDPRVLVRAGRRSKLREWVRQRLDRPGTLSQDLLTECPWCVDVIVGCLSPDPADRPRAIDLLRRINDYRIGDDISVRALESSITRASAKLTDPAGTLSRNFLLQQMVAYRVRQVEELLGQRSEGDLTDGSADQRVVDIAESRDVIIDYLCWLLGRLKPNDWMASITTLNMWQVRGLGHDGRYMTANLLALKRGVSICRVISVSLEEVGTRWFGQLLAHLCKALGYPEEYIFKRNAVDPHDLLLGPHWRAPRSGVKDLAMQDLVHMYSLALEEGRLNSLKIVDRSQSPSASAGPSVQHAMQQRFRDVVKSYDTLFKRYGAKVGTHRKPSSVQVWSEPLCRTEPVRPATNLEEKTWKGLFLGIRLVDSLSQAIEIHSKCPNTLLCHGRNEYTMFETESTGRGDTHLNPSPSLRRVKVFVGFEDRTNEHVTLTKLNEVLKQESPKVVNLGVLIPELSAALHAMQSEESSP